MSCPFGIANHLVIDANNKRSQQLVAALKGDAEVSDSVEVALEKTNPGCVTILVASRLLDHHVRRDLPQKYDDWWIVAYDERLPAEQVVSMLIRYREQVERQRRQSSLVDLPPEGLEVLRLAGHTPQRMGNQFYYS